MGGWGWERRGRERDLDLILGIMKSHREVLSRKQILFSLGFKISLWLCGKQAERVQGWRHKDRLGTPDNSTDKTIG